MTDNKRLVISMNDDLWLLWLWVAVWILLKLLCICACRKSLCKNYENDAEEARVHYITEHPEGVTVNTVNNPGEAPSVYVIKNESKIEDPPPPYPVSQ